MSKFTFHPTVSTVVMGTFIGLRQLQLELHIVGRIFLHASVASTLMHLI